jgi:hypothetical protein
MDNAFKYIKENGGIETEADYPYHAKDGKCHFDKSKVAATCTGYVDIPAQDEAALKEAVATNGPVSVAIGIYYKNVFFFLNNYFIIFFYLRCNTREVYVV